MAFGQEEFDPNDHNYLLAITIISISAIPITTFVVSRLVSTISSQTDVVHAVNLDVDQKCDGREPDEPYWQSETGKTITLTAKADGNNQCDMTVTLHYSMATKEIKIKPGKQGSITWSNVTKITVKCGNVQKDPPCKGSLNLQIS